MIVLKYGKAKKLEYAKRWKCKCSECGCKVILDKDDVPMHMTKRLTAYMSVASNNEEIVNVLKPDPILAIDMDKVRELSCMHHI